MFSRLFSAAASSAGSLAISSAASNEPLARFGSGGNVGWIFFYGSKVGGVPSPVLCQNIGSSSSECFVANFRSTSAKLVGLGGKTFSALVGLLDPTDIKLKD